MVLDRLQRAIATRPLAASILGVAAVLALWLAWSPPGANDLEGGEAAYGVMARNILAEPRQLLGPSATPLGAPGDKPPLYPAAIAALIRVLGPNELAVRLPSLLAAGLVAVATALVAGRVAGNWAMPLAALLLMTVPWFADLSRHAVGEIPLTALGVLGLALATATPLAARRAALAGALFGLAFLCQLWPAGLLLLPAAAAAWPRRDESAKPIAAMLLVALGVASAQLAAVALLRSQDLAHWWRVYWLPAAATRAVVEGIAGGVVSPAHHWNGMLRACVWLLPLGLVGAWVCVRHWREPAPRALLVWAGGLLLLSLGRIEGAYADYPVFPAWAALAAVGAVTLAASDYPPRWLVFAGAAAASPAAAELLGGPVPSAPLWAIAWLTLVAAIPVLRVGRRFAGPALAVVCLVPIAGGFARQARRLPPRYHEIGYREVAAALAPRLADAPPASASYLSAEAPAMAFYLFRSGGEWGTPARPWSPDRLAGIAGDARLRAFVVDPESQRRGGGPDPATLAWLADSAREITHEVRARSARPVRLRVFVRETAGRPPSTP